MPARDSEIDDEISLLMVSFRSARAISATEAEATVVAYMDALRGLPRWAIGNGLRKVRLGEVAGVSIDYPPSGARLRRVVTDEMVPLRADRIAIQRVLTAREVPPPNATAAARAADVAKSGLNRMQQKYGPSYGLGHIERAAELPAGAKSDEIFKPLQGDALVEYYRHHGLGRTLKQESAPDPVSEDVSGDGYEAMRR